MQRQRLTLLSRQAILWPTSSVGQWSSQSTYRRPRPCTNQGGCIPASRRQGLGPVQYKVRRISTPRLGTRHLWAQGYISTASAVPQGTHSACNTLRFDTEYLVRAVQAG